MNKLLKLAFFVMLLSGLAACHQTMQHQESHATEMAVMATGIFGDEITAEGTIMAAELPGLFTEADSVATKLSGHISSSCKHSGCWMELDLDGENAVYVTFLDDGFTIPLDAAGKNAIVEGMAYRQLIPVETLQNYAREDGKSDEEIAAITEPVWEYEFVAKGVIIEE